jgi:hypothetical protein
LVTSYQKFVIGSWLLAITGVSQPAGASQLAVAAQPVEVRKIWDAAPHNAFTDLIRFRGRWYCVFREGKAHVSPDGAVRILTSRDGRDWTSAGQLRHPNADLRDPKLTVTPQNLLMITAAGAWPAPSSLKHQTYAWFSRNGTEWKTPVPIGEPNVWLWRIGWHKQTAYGVGYDTAANKFVRWYKSNHGRDFAPWVPTLFAEGQPNEAGMVFRRDGSASILLRRDGRPGTGMLGSSRYPFRTWQWKDTRVRIGGPQMIALPDGRLIAAVRLYEPAACTAIVWVDPATGRLTELLRLPSGGDTSYAGLVWHDHRLWISYYSSHEGKTSIYLAKIRVPPKR